jgi:hypothetical protein
MTTEDRIVQERLTQRLRHYRGWKRQNSSQSGVQQGRFWFSPKRSGFQLDWLCPKCFEACRQELGFVVDPDHPQWQKAGM